MTQCSRLDDWLNAFDGWLQRHRTGRALIATCEVLKETAPYWLMGLAVLLVLI